MKTFIWITFALLAALWTGGTYAVAVAVRWAGGWLGSGTAVDLAGLVTNWSLPSWLLQWLDAALIQAVQLALLSMIESLQGAWPELGHAVTWLVPLLWLVWAIGLLVLLLLAGGAHWLARRASTPSSPQPVPAG